MLSPGLMVKVALRGIKLIVSISRNALDKELDDICVATGAILCENIKCQNANHKRDIDDLCDKMIQACLKSGDLCFPKCKPYNPCKAGWNSEVKLLRGDSLFWHHIWVDSGHPFTGALAQVMRSTRGKYYRAVRDVKKRDEQLRRIRLGAKASSNNAVIYGQSSEKSMV